MRSDLSREHDEQTLEFVRLRSSGSTPSDIARMFGVQRASVSRATAKVRDADIAESGEPEAYLAYWGAE